MTSKLEIDVGTIIGPRHYPSVAFLSDLSRPEGLFIGITS